MAVKKYYWLKLKSDFFTSREMKKLRKIAGGDTYTIIYLKLQLLSLKNEGILRFEGTEENIVEQLALEIDESVDNVAVTLKFMESNNLLESLDKDEILISKVPESIGKETDSAERMRRLRSKNNDSSEQSCHNVTHERHFVTQSKRKSIDIEINIYSAFFDEMWEVYPEKKGKGRISKTKQKEIYKIKDDFKKAMQRYLAYVETRRKEGFDLNYQNGSTFFNSGYVDYLDENYQEYIPEKKSAKPNTFHNYSDSEQKLSEEELERILLKNREGLS